MKNKKIKTLLAVFIIIIGLGLFSYPAISYIWNGYRDSRLITEYNHSVAKTGEQESKDILEDARKYNEKIARRTSKNVVGIDEDLNDTIYQNLLNFGTNSIMGYIEIPAISAKIPIYHYSSADVLESGIGHLYGSSLPIGGESAHSVLTGHTGLSSASLFSDLNKVKKGDEFYIHVYDQTLVYKVCQIQTVLPEDVDSLKLEEGRDLVTLITCTPYAINTHRLLVTGERTEYIPEKIESINNTDMVKQAFNPTRLLVIEAAVVFLFVFLIITIRRRKVEKNIKENKRSSDVDDNA